ncbi:response regulator [bacterium]|nr:MAG: response regulator [bacterium]
MNLKKRILVADDDGVILTSLQEILEVSGYEVITSTNGKECLEKFISEKPDLVVLDIMMPGMDGYDFLISLKQMAALKGDDLGLPDILNIPVIVVTARGDDKAKDMIGKENIKDYIVKPYDVPELLNKVKKLLE